MNPLFAAALTFFGAFPLIMFLNQVLFYNSCFKGHCLEAASGKVVLFSLIASGIAYALAGQGKENKSGLTQQPDTTGSKTNQHTSRSEVNSHRIWKDENRQNSYGGWVYVFNIPDRNLFKIGMTAYEPWDRMLEYCERYSLKPDPKSLRKYKVPDHLKTALVEEHIHSFILLRGYQKPKEIVASEVFFHPGDYPAVVGHVAKSFEQAID